MKQEYTLPLNMKRKGSVTSKNGQKGEDSKTKLVLINSLEDIYKNKKSRNKPQPSKTQQQPKIINIQSVNAI